MALIELIRCGSSQDLHDFPLDKYVDSPAEKAFSSGWYWGPFVMEVDKKEYHYCQRRRPCEYMYEGKFELRGGRWEATPPQSVSIALVEH